jgi:hypothetical protein
MPKGRKGAKYKQNYKLEYRNPKFETISNDQNKNTMFQTILIQIRRLGFSEFEIYWLRFVSDFVLRVWDFKLEVFKDDDST